MDTWNTLLCVSKLRLLFLVRLIFYMLLQIKNLPKGATVIDYAYMIHTDIGNSMVAAKASPFLFDEYFLSRGSKV